MVETNFSRGNGGFSEREHFFNSDWLVDDATGLACQNSEEKEITEKGSE
jgi:hypothetical protein